MLQQVLSEGLTSIPQKTLLLTYPYRTTTVDSTNPRQLPRFRTRATTTTTIETSTTVLRSISTSKQNDFDIRENRSSQANTNLTTDQSSSARSGLNSNGSTSTVSSVSSSMITPRRRPQFRLSSTQTTTTTTIRTTTTTGTTTTKTAQVNLNTTVGVAPETYENDTVAYDNDEYDVQNSNNTTSEFPDSNVHIVPELDPYESPFSDTIRTDIDSPVDITGRTTTTTPKPTNTTTDSSGFQSSQITAIRFAGSKISSASMTSTLMPMQRAQTTITNRSVSATTISSNDYSRNLKTNSISAQHVTTRHPVFTNGTSTNQINTTTYANRTQTSTQKPMQYLNDDDYSDSLSLNTTAMNDSNDVEMDYLLDQTSPNPNNTKYTWSHSDDLTMSANRSTSSETQTPTAIATIPYKTTQKVIIQEFSTKQQFQSKSTSTRPNAITSITSRASNTATRQFSTATTPGLSTPIQTPKPTNILVFHESATSGTNRTTTTNPMENPGATVPTTKATDSPGQVKPTNFTTRLHIDNTNIVTSQPKSNQTPNAFLTLTLTTSLSSNKEPTRIVSITTSRPQNTTSYRSQTSETMSVNATQQVKQSFLSSSTPTAQTTASNNDRQYFAIMSLSKPLFDI
jgi:hypothetical protein